MIVIICGVSGAGKTTVGELLARELGWHFYEADDFHSTANIFAVRWQDRMITRTINRPLTRSALLASTPGLLAETQPQLQPALLS